MPEAPSLEALGLLRPLWTHLAPGGKPIYSSPIGPVMARANGERHRAVVLCGWDGHVSALRADTGQALWRARAGGPCYGRCQAADVDGDGAVEIFAPGHDGLIRCLSDDGTLRWTFASLYGREASGQTSRAGPRSLTDDSKAWAANAFLRVQGRGHGALLRITSGPGAGQAREVVGNPGGSTLTVAEPWDVLPVAGDTYRVEPRWPSDRYYQHAGTLVHEPGGWFLYAGGFDNQLCKIDARSGALVWQYAALENIEPYPLVLAADGGVRVYSACVDGRTRCLDGATGALIWEADTGPTDAFIAAADVNGDGRIELLVSSRDNRAYILDAHRGRVLGISEDIGADIDCAAMPVHMPGQGSHRIVTGCDAGKLWCIDGSGRTVWRQPLSTRPINSSAVVHDVLGRGSPAVLIGDMEGSLHCVDVATGGVIGSLRLAGGIEGVPWYGDLDGDGHAELVVTTTAGEVRAWRFAHGGVWLAPWYPGRGQFEGSVSL